MTYVYLQEPIREYQCAKGHTMAVGRGGKLPTSKGELSERCPLAYCQAPVHRIGQGSRGPYKTKGRAA